MRQVGPIEEQVLVTNPTRMNALRATGLLVQAVRRAASDGARALRLEGAATSVTLHVGSCDRTDESVALFFASTGIDIERTADADTEAAVWISPEALLAFCHGTSSFSIALLRGEATYRGPVRKFLRVAPIIAAHAQSRGAGMRLGAST